MKNTNKIISIVVLVAVLVATVAGAYLGFAGRNTQMVTVTENGVETQRALYRQVAFIPNTFNTTWKEAIIPSAQLGGGIEYVFTAEQGDMTDADFSKAVKTAAKAMASRAQMIAGDAYATYDGATISVSAPSADYDSLMSTVLTPVGEITFCLYDTVTGLFGDPILTSEHVKDAGYTSDTTGYQLQVQLNKKGQKALAACAKEHTGETLYILMDGSYMGDCYLTATMNTQVLSARVSDWTYALTAAVCLRTGELPFNVALTTYNPVEGSMASLLDIVVMGMTILSVLAALFVILRGKVAGLISALTLAAQGVVFCLIMALIAVDASWKLSVTALVLLTACQLLFIGGLIMTNEQIAKSLKHRGLKQAVATGMKNSVKPLSVVFGALVVLGVLLMMLFAGTPASYLGRLVALSGIISFAMIFVALRVLLSCVVTIKSGK